MGDETVGPAAADMELSQSAEARLRELLSPELGGDADAIENCISEIRSYVNLASGVTEYANPAAMVMERKALTGRD